MNVQVFLNEICFTADPLHDKLKSILYMWKTALDLRKFLSSSTERSIVCMCLMLLFVK